MKEIIEQLIAKRYRVFMEVHSTIDACVGITRDQTTLDGVHFCEQRFMAEDLEDALIQALEWVRSR